MVVNITTIAVVTHLDPPSCGLTGGFHRRVAARLQNGDICPMAKEPARAGDTTSLERLPACTDFDSTRDNLTIRPVLQSEPNPVLLLLLACQDGLCWIVHRFAFQPLNPEFDIYVSYHECK